jgi:hypothetical protein
MIPVARRHQCDRNRNSDEHREKRSENRLGSTAGMRRTLAAFARHSKRLRLAPWYVGPSSITDESRCGQCVTDGRPMPVALARLAARVQPRTTDSSAVCRDARSLSGREQCA